jgi:SWI/SNF-related matrix-associated actin-dependent regulator of chromatin subfamily A-like protein 1
MALSSIIKQTCKECGKIAIQKSMISFGKSKLITLECGHTITSTALASTNYDSIVSADGKNLLPYQIDGIRFLENADARAILADEQGLGKTVQALGLLKLHREKLTPAVIVCPTTVKEQWRHEIKRWCGINGFLTQVIASSKELAAPGFDIYVTTYDLLKHDKCFDIVRGNIKFIIADECQRIKNHLSGRAKAFQKIAKDVEHLLPMSGTPIKNNAGEYYTVLNAVAPRLFPHYQRFIDEDCDSFNNGGYTKIGGLRNPARFHEKTKEFILRRTKAEVLPDLPKLMRKFMHVEFDGKFKKAYIEKLSELEDIMYGDDPNSFASNSSKIAIMTKMREITGVSKVENCVDYVTEFLLSSDRKMVIFTHHHSATNLLIQKLNAWLSDGGYGGVIHLSASLNGDERQNVTMKFKDNPEYRVMVASTLAAGEGLNLQFCSDAVMLERQWNPANEEQAEGRFHRIGQVNSVSVEYMIASETIDEYFTELVESKRAIVASTLDNKEIQWDQNSLMQDLAMVLITKGKKAWKL